MDSKIVNFSVERKIVLTRVMIIYLSLRTFLQLVMGSKILKLYLENSFYLQIVLTLSAFIVSLIGLIGFIKVNQMMCTLFLGFLGLETLYTIVRQISSTQMLLEKYSFNELKNQLIGAYLGSIAKLLIVVLGVFIVYSNKIEKRKLLSPRQEVEVYRKREMK